MPMPNPLSTRPLVRRLCLTTLLPGPTRRRAADGSARAIPALLARIGRVPLLLLTGCTGTSPTTTPPPPPASMGGVLALESGMGAVEGGIPRTIAGLVTTIAGRPLQGVEVEFLTGPRSGSVTTRVDTSDATGRVGTTWTPEDREGEQSLTLTAPMMSPATWRVTATPRLVALSLQSPAEELTRYGVPEPIGVQARTVTGRLLDVTAASEIRVVQEHRAFDAHPVLSVSAGPSVTALSPGSATLVATRGALVSPPLTLAVNSRQPFVAALSPTEIPEGTGGVITLLGRHLDALSVVPIGIGDATETPQSVTATTATIRVLPGAAACSSTGLRQITWPGAFFPRAMALRVLREAELDLAIGDVRRLSTEDATCVQLAPHPTGSYRVAYFDSEPIERARTSLDDGSVPFTPRAVTIENRSRMNGAIVTQAASRAPTPAVRSDVRPGWAPGPTQSARTASPELAAHRRATPWSQGDHFSLYLAEPGRAGYVPGTVFHATPQLALATFDDEAGRLIPQRVERLQETLGVVASSGQAALTAAFGQEWPRTSEGAGQVLVLITSRLSCTCTAVLRWDSADGALQQGVWIALDDTGPVTQPYQIDAATLIHELTHAAQDRIAYRRCRDTGQCGGTWFRSTWGVEGSAAWVAEDAMRRRAGFSPTANVSAAQLQGTSAGPQFLPFLFLDHPHFRFTDGYAASSWFLSLTAGIAIATGRSEEEVMRELHTGALEGWYGVGLPSIGPVHGMVSRVRALLGSAWDPAEALLTGVLAISSDDLTANPELQHPMLQEYWRYLPPADTLTAESGHARTFDLGTNGGTFAHYVIEDRGIGGSYRFLAPPSFGWAIVRVR